MTIYERTRQLERRKNIATGVVVVSMATAMLCGCFKVASNADKGIDLSVTESTEIFEATATIPEVAEYELACVEVDVVSTPLEEEEEVIEESSETETTANTVEKYSKKEIAELSHMVWAESGSKGDEAMYATATVIVNRLNSKKYPNTIHKVLTERRKSKGKWVYQYSPAKNNRYMKNSPSKRCEEIARDVLVNGNTTLPTDYFGQASKSLYQKYGKDYKEIGGIYFFNLK